MRVAVDGTLPRYGRTVTALRCHTTQAVASSVASARHTPDHAARTARRGHAHGELRSLFFPRWPVHSCARLEGTEKHSPKTEGT